MTLDLHKTLPKTWALIQLGTLTEKVETRNSDFAPDGEFFYIDIASIDNSSNKITSPKKYQWKNAPSRARQVVKENDIVFSTVRTYLMNIALVPPSLSGQIASTGFTVIRARKEIHHKLLFYRTLSREFVEALNELQRGTSYPAVRDRDVFAQFFPLPPLAEQHRIVDKIEELFSDLDDGIASLKKAQQQLKVYRQAVLKWAFEGKLTAQWREEQKRQGKLESADTLLEQIKAEREQRYQTELAAWKADVEAWEANGKVGKRPSKPSKPDNLPLNNQEELKTLAELPYGWFWSLLGNISSKIQIGPFGSLLHKSDYVTDQIPAINPTHIYGLKIHPDRDFTITSEKFDDLRKYALEVGDIIMGRRGEMGRCALVTKKEHGFLCGTGSLYIRLASSLNGSFYSYFLSSRGTRSYLENNSIGTTMKNLNEDVLNNVPVVVCSPIEQAQIIQEIESRLSICDSFDATIADNLQRAEALRQSILKQAFEGKLVPQDPNDEPASVLLERIRTFKSAQAEGNKQTKRKQSL